MGNILSTGISGLNAAQANLTTTSHNIANADTPGYTRQQVIQSTNFPQSTGAGFIGRGVNITTVQRIHSQFLTTQLLQVQTQSSQLDNHYNQIKQIDNLLADPVSGLSPALQDFFSGVNDVAANPSSVPSRQAMISNAQALVSRFHSLDQRLSEMHQAVNTEISSSVSEINSLAKQISELNHNILLAEGAAGGHPANDLLDQRDALTNQLSKLVNTDIVKQRDGTLNIFIGSGQALVVGNQSMSLKAMVSFDNPQKTTIGLVNGSSTMRLPEHLIHGGSLGGTLSFRNESLSEAQNALGQIAINLAQTFNEQHNLGLDLNGNLGTDFFSVPQPQVFSHTANNPASNITADISNVGALTTSDYRFSFDGINYTLTRLSDNQSVSAAAAPTAGSPLIMDGLRISSATINANERFLIQPTINGAKNIVVNISDTAKIAAAAPVRTEAALSNTSNAAISQGSINPLPLDPNLQQPVTITFHSPYDGQFDVTGTGSALPANNQVYTEGADISFNGWTIQINGQPAAGDIFTIEPNHNGSADNRNALLLAGLQTQNTMVGGTASFQETYGQMVSSIGNKTRELEVTSKAQNNLVTQTERSLQAISGVNLDEEAANLLRYQHAFQASSKVIEISSSLFETILRIG
ncbi:flagellar hook-associated protein 1 FlgK [Nitrosomonas sp. Nm51]|uniref:flagellar hook-associated protein FlgK n=1 Tax=Nitrosomonas sp. Nm51 TaxID=133720 RepID=UPI0008BCF5AF|nr:flagellar hook-associated protein FlgK [Nitrosomonas sp. Nm51]SER11898.1 flagellar hook-associated protein 1 FlgK [Nitrosomonas sp. Nm51]